MYLNNIPGKYDIQQPQNVAVMGTVCVLREALM